MQWIVWQCVCYVYETSVCGFFHHWTIKPLHLIWLKSYACLHGISTLMTENGMELNGTVKLLCKWTLNINKNKTEKKELLILFILFFTNPFEISYTFELRHTWVENTCYDTIDLNRYGDMLLQQLWIMNYTCMHIYLHEKYSNTFFNDPHIHRFATYLRLLFASTHQSHSVKYQLPIGSHKSTATESLRLFIQKFYWFFFFKACLNKWPQFREIIICFSNRYLGHNSWIITFLLRFTWFTTNVFRVQFTE